MRALHRKLLRDVWRTGAQCLAIALVAAAGVGMFDAYLSTFRSLEATRARFYEEARFSHVFARCTRAPRDLLERLAAIPNVAAVDGRVVVDVTLDLAARSAPAIGRLVSLPPTDRFAQNALVLTWGRWPEAARSDEVLVHEAFAEANQLRPGDTLAAIVNGRRRTFTVTGAALSPEYVYVLGPGALVPDHEHFGVIWMDGRSLASAFRMEGAWNDVTLRLAPERADDDGALRSVVAEVDRLLERFGGLGAIGRAHQASHWFLENELRELRTMASVLPTIFLGVAAFLVNVVLSRIVAVQRTQIAALRALGYTAREVALHYLAIGLAIALLGAALGHLAGARLGLGLTRLYAEYFRFPEFVYALPADVALVSTLIGLAAAGLGAVGAVRRVDRLPPAEAMRPEPPERYQRTWPERLGVVRGIGPIGRMVLRNAGRRPWRFGLSALGVGLSIGLMIAGLFFLDALDQLIRIQFEQAERQDLTVTFVDPRSPRVRFELERMPGVLAVEPFRAVPVRLRSGQRSREVVLQGRPAEPSLGRVVDRSGAGIRLPPDGLVLSRSLADAIGAERGGRIMVEVLEGARPIVRIEVSRVVDDLVGLSAYMEIGALDRLLGEEGSVSGARLVVDPRETERLYRSLQATPHVAGVMLTQRTIESFRETIRTNVRRIIGFNVLFSALIAIGVAYNVARVALSERARELASLRILGFTRAEISIVLLGELALVVIAAIPLGVVSGTALAGLMLVLLQNELYRIPFFIEPSTYGWAIVTGIVASAFAGALVRHRLDRLDLIAVLKTQE